MAILETRDGTLYDSDTGVVVGTRATGAAFTGQRRLPRRSAQAVPSLPAFVAPLALPGRVGRTTVGRPARTRRGTGVKRKRRGTIGRTVAKARRSAKRGRSAVSNFAGGIFTLAPTVPEKSKGARGLGMRFRDILWETFLESGGGVLSAAADGVTRISANKYDDNTALRTGVKTLFVWLLKWAGRKSMAARSIAAGFQGHNAGRAVERVAERG